MAVLPGGRRALSGSEDETIRLWDLETGAELRRFGGDIGFVLSVAVLPDGPHALSGSFDRIMRLWDLDTGAELRRFEGRHSKWIEAVAVVAGGRALSGSGDHTMWLWDLRTSRDLGRFDGHTGTISSVAALPDPGRALSGSHDGTCRLWDLGTRAEVRRLEGHQAGINSVAVLADGLRAVSGSADRTVRLWDLQTGAELHRFEGHVTPITSVAMLSDGRRALSGSEDGTLRLWDVEAGVGLRTFEGQAGGIGSLAVLPDGQRVLCGLSDGTLRLWEIEPGGAETGSAAEYEAAIAWVKAYRRDRGDGDKKPTCFISYAWGDSQHERWIEQLADHLQDAEVTVTLDRWHNPPGTSVVRFIERITAADFVCVAGTPRYRLKDQATDADSVAQAERGLINSRLRRRQEIRDTVIPLLCEGQPQEAFPPLLEDTVFVDFRTKADFLLGLFELVLTIHRIPFSDRAARGHLASLRGRSGPAS